MKMLVAIDDSEYAIKIVNYVASAVKPTVNITLFSVLPTMSSNLEKIQKDLQQPLFSEKVRELRWMVDEGKKKAESRIEECRTILKNAGFSDDSIEVKMQNKVVGIARDIIAEAGKGKYDRKGDRRSAAAIVRPTPSPRPGRSGASIPIW